MQALHTALISAFGTILVAFVGLLTRKAVAFLDEKGISNLFIQKREITKTAVYAVEQIYKELNGPQKLVRAKEIAQKEMRLNGIDITNEELSLFIEAIVSEIKKESGYLNELMLKEK